MNTDTAATLAGAGTATVLLSQINFSQSGWWKQAIVALGVLVLGYFTNKVKTPPVTLADAGNPAAATAHAAEEKASLAADASRDTPPVL